MPKSTYHESNPKQIERDLFIHPRGPQFLHVLRQIVGPEGYGIRAFTENLGNPRKEHLTVYRTENYSPQISVSGIALQKEGTTDLHIRVRRGNLFYPKEISPDQPQILYAEKDDHAKIAYDKNGLITQQGSTGDIGNIVEDIKKKLGDQEETSKKLEQYLKTLSIEDEHIFTDPEAQQMASAASPFTVEYIISHEWGKGIEKDLRFVKESSRSETMRAMMYLFDRIAKEFALHGDKKHTLQDPQKLSKIVLYSFLEYSPPGFLHQRTNSRVAPSYPVSFKK